MRGEVVFDMEMRVCLYNTAGGTRGQLSIQYQLSHHGGGGSGDDERALEMPLIARRLR